MNITTDELFVIIGMKEAELLITRKMNSELAEKVNQLQSELDKGSDDGKVIHDRLHLHSD